jgi:fructose-bisphosphate aldolase class II
MAHKVGVTVEGELGCLGNLETGDAGEEDGIGAEGKLDHSQMLTDPEEAAQFVKATQLDALAIAIGTSHGAYKFSRRPPATSWPSAASRKSTPASPTPTW